MRATFLLLPILIATQLQAQSIRGVVREQTAGVPVRGAFVSVRDSAGRVKLGVLTDTIGHYTLRLSKPGRYSVRAEMIGQSTDQAVIDVSAGSAVTHDFTLHLAPIEIEAISATSTKRCSVHPESAEETARVWDEIRKALNVQAWGEKQRNVRLQTLSFERVVDARNGTVLEERSSVSPVVGRGYAAVSPDTLARYGFSRRLSGDSTEYFGPDADVLLSDVFLDSHCFTVVHGRGRNEGLLGLTFKPVRASETTDISGSLWLDARTSELEYIDYKYENLPAIIDYPEIGGETHFRHLASGAWLVDRWFIRLPLSVATDRVRVYSEAGGQIASISDADSKYDVPLAKITGTVWDSTRAAPLADAIIYLSGTAFRTKADSLGRYVLPVEEGAYNLSFAHPRLDSLPALPQPRAIHVPAAGLRVDLKVGSEKALVARACGPGEQGLVFGYVSSPEGTVGEGVNVTATYGAGSNARTVTAATDPSGRYMICHIPLGALVRIRLEDELSDYFVKLENSRFARRDLNKR